MVDIDDNQAVKYAVLSGTVGLVLWLLGLLPVGGGSRRSRNGRDGQQQPTGTGDTVITVEGDEEKISRDYTTNDVTRTYIEEQEKNVDASTETTTVTNTDVTRENTVTRNTELTTDTTYQGTQATDPTGEPEATDTTAETDPNQQGTGEEDQQTQPKGGGTDVGQQDTEPETTGPTDPEEAEEPTPTQTDREPVNPENKYDTAFRNRGPYGPDTPDFPNTDPEAYNPDLTAETEPDSAQGSEDKASSSDTGPENIEEATSGDIRVTRGPTGSGYEGEPSGSSEDTSGSTEEESSGDSGFEVHGVEVGPEEVGSAGAAAAVTGGLYKAAQGFNPAAPAAAVSGVPSALAAQGERVTGAVLPEEAESEEGHRLRA